MKVENSKKKTDKNRELIARYSMGLGIVLLGILIMISITKGAASISYETIWDAFMDLDIDNSKHLLVRNMRLPRALAAMLVGSALAVAGAMMQGMTRNPLADSGLMGLSAGAGLFLAISLIFLQGISYSQMIFTTFMGAAFGATCVYIISSLVPGGNSAMKLVLAGATVSTMFSALSQGIAISEGRTQSMMFWTMGNVSGTNWKQLSVAAPVILVSILIAIIISRQVSIMSMGEEVALGLGINLRKTKLIGTIVVVLLSGTSFAISGNITFVGMMIPHFTRFLVGPDYRLIIPLSGILGALLVVFADILAKTLYSPTEIPLGAIISLVGVPIFLYYARHQRGNS